MSPETNHILAPAILALVMSSVVVACRDAPLDVMETPEFSRNADLPAVAAYQKDLAKLRAATAPYHNLDTAMDAGYNTQFTPCWYHADLGAMGYHYGNPAAVDGNVALLQPEVLVYEPQPGGHFRLVALEYLVPIPAWTGTEPPELLGEKFVRDDDLGFYLMHVWLWRNNPEGLFAPWNPRVTCEHAAESEDRGGH